MKTQKTKMISPKDAKSYGDWLALKTIYSLSPKRGMTVSRNGVFLEDGSHCTVWFSRRDFNKLVKFYTAPQKVKP